MTGIFNLKRPTRPNYNFIWDVEKVLSFHSISDKELTLKLTMLLALTAASRASEICNLDIRYLVRHSSEYVFQFSKLSKT